VLNGLAQVEAPNSRPFDYTNPITTRRAFARSNPKPQWGGRKNQAIWPALARSECVRSSAHSKPILRWRKWKKRSQFWV